MDPRPFEAQELRTVDDALYIAEDVTSNFFKFSPGQWKRHRYDVKTLPSLNQDEISKYAFALLNKGSRLVSGFESKTKIRDFYFICLQDDHILNALGRDKNLSLLPLLVYVLTHELVHIVRFCNFYQRFELAGRGRDREEAIVHSLTHDILNNLSLAQLDYVLESYRGHTVCDLTSCPSYSA